MREATRRLAKRREPVGGRALDREHSIELAYLAVATVYSLTLPLKHSITLVDAVGPRGDLRRCTRSGSRGRRPRSRISSGPARYLGTFATRGRRTTIVGDVRVRRRRDPAVRRALRRGAGRDRRGARDQRVPPGAVAGAARVGGARAAGRRPLRVAAEHERGPRHARLLEGEPVDAAGRHAADRVRDRGRRPPRAADRRAQREELFLTAAQSFFAVAVLVEPRDVDARGRGCCSRCSGRSSSWAALVPERLHGVERIGVGVVYLLLGTVDLARPASCQLSATARANAFRARYGELASSSARVGPPVASTLVDPRAFLTARRPTRRRADPLVHVRELAGAPAVELEPVPRRPARAARRPARAHRRHRPLPAPGRGLEAPAAGRNVVMATGTASGKTLVYNLAFARGRDHAPEGDRAVPVPDEGAGARSAPLDPRR